MTLEPRWPLSDAERAAIAAELAANEPDVEQLDLLPPSGLTIGSLFSGYGGLDLAVEEVFGARTVWRSDIKPAACKLIEHYWPGTNLGDITAINWDNVEPVDIITGGFPCTDISAAGRQAGLIRLGQHKTRSGLWAEMCQAVNRLRPAYMVAENVRAITSVKADSDLEPCPWCVGDGPTPDMRALGAVLGDLADVGYDAAWFGLRAADVGACHGRFRIFILAWPATDAGHRDDPEWPRAARRTTGERQPVRREPRRDSGFTTPRPDDVGHQRSRFARDGRPRPTDRAVTTPELPTWGHYAAAVQRWGHVIGRPAPAPTEPGPKGGQRLSPRLTEWMMGLPDGHITAVPGLSRSDMLSLCGDGVVPQQAAAALRYLLAATGAS